MAFDLFDKSHEFKAGYTAGLANHADKNPYDDPVRAADWQEGFIIGKNIRERSDLFRSA